MDNNEIALLNLIKKSVFNVEVSFPEDTDWEAVRREAEVQTVVALAGTAVPKTEYEKWRVPAAQSTAHYIRVLFEQTNLVNLFIKNNIPLVILKGAAAAVYYPDPQYRTMGDIDFIVSPEHYQDAVKLMENNGYVPEEADEERHRGFSKGGIAFELHCRYSHKEFDIEPIVTDGMERAVIRTLSGHSFPTLPDFENGFVILEHIYHHIHNAIGIRQIIDWAVFVNRVLNDENYKKGFLPLIESVGLVAFAETLTKMCKMYIGLPDTFSWCDGADADSATELMQIFVSKGNFGIKAFYKGKRSLQKFTFNAKRNGFFKTLQETGVSNFPICQRNWLFRPFAWLFQTVHFVWRGIVALLKRERLIKDINDGKKKADLYKRLGL